MLTKLTTSLIPLYNPFDTICFMAGEGDESGGGGGGGGDQGGGGGDQGGETSFLDSLPDDLRQSPTLADIKDVEGLAKGYVEAQKLIGAKRVVVPSSDANEEQVNEFYKTIGRPDSADEYKFEVPEIEGADFTNTINWAKPVFHKAGLTQKQGQMLLSALADSTKENLAAQKQASVDIQAELEAAFGDKLPQKLDGARSAALEFGGQEFVEMMEAAGLMNEPDFVRTFSNIQEKTMEHRVIDGEGNKNFTPGPAQAAQEIETLKADTGFMAAYQDRSNPGHRGAVERMQKLFKLAYPEPK